MSPVTKLMRLVERPPVTFDLLGASFGVPVLDRQLASMLAWKAEVEDAVAEAKYQEAFARANPNAVRRN